MRRRGRARSPAETVSSSRKTSDSPSPTNRLTTRPSKVRAPFQAHGPFGRGPGGRALLLGRRRHRSPAAPAVASDRRSRRSSRGPGRTTVSPVSGSVSAGRITRPKTRTPARFERTKEARLQVFAERDLAGGHNCSRRRLRRARPVKTNRSDCFPSRAAASGDPAPAAWRVTVASVCSCRQAGRGTRSRRGENPRHARSSLPGSSTETASTSAVASGTTTERARAHGHETSLSRGRHPFQPHLDAIVSETGRAA